jgi:maleate isomerase
MSDYAALGLVAVATPQANTTVESEMSVLLKPGLGLATVRLHSQIADARARLVGYLDRLAPALETLDNAPVVVAGFACTGTSYLLDAGREAAELERLGALRKHPVISASQSIRAALQALGARRIAIVSPYPAWLRDACVAYLPRWGMEITQVQGLPGDRSDTRRIYALGGRQIQEGLAALRTENADAILISGTGAPTLGPLARYHGALPLLSSNLCLAWALEQTAAGAALDAASLQAKLADPGWRGRLAQRFPQALEGLD